MEKLIKIFVPDFFWQKVEKNSELKKILANMNWLFLDKIIQMAVAFFVGVWMIRYLGPEKYGILSYAVATVALFGAFSKLGLESVIIKEIVRAKFEKGILLGTSFGLRVISGAIALLGVAIFVFTSRMSDQTSLILSLVLSVTLILQSSNVIDYWFQSEVHSKAPVIVRSSTSIIGGILKILIILTGGSLLSFASVILMESLIVFLGSFFAYRIQKKKAVKWSFSYDLARILLKESWPLMFSSIAIVVYMKIDQIMIGNMLGNSYLGSYSAAVAICEIWYFIPAIIVGSVFPSMIYAQNKSESLFLKRMQILYDTLIWLAILIAIPVSLFSSQIITMLYGVQYEQADSVLSIYIWAGVFVFLNAGVGRYLVAKNLSKIAFSRSVAGAVMNILLNLFLIPWLGIKGAALATLLSYGVATVTSCVPKSSRINAKLFVNSLNVIRILKYFYNVIIK